MSGARPVVVLLRDEEVAVDASWLAGLTVTEAVVEVAPDVWDDSVLVLAPSAGGVKGRARRLLGSRPPDRVRLLPRSPMPGQVPTQRLWMSAAVTQVEAVLARTTGVAALVVAGDRAAIIGWHLQRRRPDVAVVAAFPAVGDLVRSPRLDDLVAAAAQQPGWEMSALAGALLGDVGPMPALRVVEGEEPGVDLDDDGAAVLVGAAYPVPSGEPAGDVGAPGGGPRLVIGAANFSGQAAAWARAGRAAGLSVRSWGIVPERSAFVFPSDVAVSDAEWTDAVVRARLVADELVPATHVLAESMRPLVGLGWRGRIHPASIEAAALELERLLASGRRVGVVMHGSEARSPDAHAELYPFSPFEDPSLVEERAKRVEQSAKIHAVLDRLPVARFVTTPDMLDFVPGAAWLPLTLGPGSLRPGRPAFGRDRPVFLHSPSAGPVKGSPHVEAVLAPLHDAGVIEYRRLSGVPSWEMPFHVRDADVVIDQLMAGGSGTISAQAMAAGRLVVCHVASHVRARYDAELPILEADPTTLRDVVAGILADRDAAAARAARGPAFARDQHDGRRAAAVLAEFLAT